MAKRSSKKTRRATTKRPATRQAAPSRPAEPGKYALGKEIGRGGLGRVVEAVDAEIGRTVALKLLLEGAPLDLVERFKREGRITGRLEHPNIVPVHEVGHLPGEKGRRGEIFFAMKKIAGRDLADVLKEFRSGKGAWTLRHLVEVFRDVCRAMAFAHSKGVIHRDIKPSNVMVGEFGEVLVVDWGLAKVVGSPESGVGRKSSREADAPLLTLDGDIFGTPDYMSPEQADGRIELIDERSDVFSLGAVLYEILAGRPPFAGGTTTEILRRVIEGNPTRPTDLLQTLDPASRGASASTPQPFPASFSIPPEIEAVCLRALAKDRAARHPSAAALQSDLQAWLDGDLERERRERVAAEQLVRGREELASLDRLDAEAAAAEDEARRLADKLPTWAPDPDCRAAWAAEDRASELRRQSLEAFAAADAALAAVLSNVRAHAEARRLRAALHWKRFLDAEAAGEERGMVSARRVAEAHNDGALDQAFRDEGTLSVSAEAFGCSCLSRGRSVRPPELRLRGWHPWSGRDLGEREGQSAPEHEPAGSETLRVHGAECRAPAVPGARAWAFRYLVEDRALVPVTPGASSNPIPAPVLEEAFGDSPYRPRGGGIWLGESPTAPRALPIGSWLVVVAAPGLRPARVPVRIEREGETRLAVRLFAAAEIPPGMLPVAGGPFSMHGDLGIADKLPPKPLVLQDFFLARHPVTCGEYLEFLNELASTDPAAAARRAPRVTDGAVPYWPLTGGRYAIPTAAWLAAASPESRAAASRLMTCAADWEEDWPVMGVSWEDGCAFGRWASRRSGFVMGLPPEECWERAARGADGRPYPWGRHAETTRANVDGVKKDGRGPDSVHAFPGDESPFGIRGQGGNARQHTLTATPGVKVATRISRGGAWALNGDWVRSTHRSNNVPKSTWYGLGFRLMAAVRVPEDVAAFLK